MSEIKTVPFKVISGKNGDAAFEVDGKTLSPEEVGGTDLDQDERDRRSLPRRKSD